jgi:hypothetical protein
MAFGLIKIIYHDWFKPTLGSSLTRYVRNRNLNPSLSYMLSIPFASWDHHKPIPERWGTRDKLNRLS